MNNTTDPAERLVGRRVVVPTEWDATRTSSTVPSSRAAVGEEVRCSTWSWTSTGAPDCGQAAGDVRGDREMTALRSVTPPSTRRSLGTSSRAAVARKAPTIWSWSRPSRRARTASGRPIGASATNSTRRAAASTTRPTPGQGVRDMASKKKREAPPARASSAAHGRRTDRHAGLQRPAQGPAPPAAHEGRDDGPRQAAEPPHAAQPLEAHQRQQVEGQAWLIGS